MSPGPAPALARRAAAEAVGTALLVAVVVGSGIQAAGLTPDPGVRLLAASLATALGLGALIALLGPVSGAHFNPAVSAALWYAGRGTREGLSLRDLGVYAAAQTGGAVGGAVLANAMFAEPLVRWSAHDRSAGHLRLAELVATAGLVLLVLGLGRTGRAALAAPAVAAYIGAAYWFTSSTSFANPAVTVGRAFTDTFAGIAPACVGPYAAAQFAGAALGLALAAALFGPRPAQPSPVPVRVPSPAQAPAPVQAQAAAPGGPALPAPVSAGPPAPAAALAPAPAPARQEAP